MADGRVMGGARMAIFKEKVGKMSREELEKETEKLNDWMNECFWRWQEFKSVRDERHTMQSFTGVWCQLCLLSAAAERLNIYLTRLRQIADDDVCRKEQFDKQVV